MLLNTWLAAAKRHLFSANFYGAAQGAGAANRRSTSRRRDCAGGEQLESRTLLTALVINNSNVDNFVDIGTGNLSITNADLGAHDEIVIERIDLASTTEGISIDLSGVTLNRLAIETVNVTAFSGTGIDVNLTNVTGNRTISLEDITIANVGAGINITLNNTDSHAVTIEDSITPSVSINALNGSDIIHGIVTQNEISAPADLEGVMLTVSGSTAGDFSSANDFQIVDNLGVQALNKDAIQVNLSDAPTDGLRIANNVIGNEPGADVFFRAAGDTFVQPFEIRNNAIDGEMLQQFTLDLSDLGLVFDEGLDGKPFTVVGNTGIGATATLSSNDQILTVDFTNFLPGDVFQFVIDIDRAPAVLPGTPIAAPIFGNDLIGADVVFNFDAGNSGTVAKTVAGVLIGDADIFNSAVFARGAGAAANVHGINLNLTNSPLTNTEVVDNVITGVAGHGILVGAHDVSDITGIMDRNTITSSGQDGIRFELEDSNFTGALRDNTIGQNSGHGINFLPSVSRSGFVEEAFDGTPIQITSTNHGLQTGDVIVIQGMTNANPNINHPGNGTHTITRTGNNTFTLNGTNGLVSGVNYNAGGAWYVPDFQGGTANGLVKIDVQGTQPEGRITDIVNPAGAGDVIFTSVGHGLSSGDRIRVSGATGTLITGDYKITVLSANTFSLDGVRASGAYDKSGGLARWTSNLITGATNPLTGGIVITSVGHGLQTGDQIRVANVGGNTAANGTHRITVLTADTFLLQGTTGTGGYSSNTGYWTPIAETTFTGDTLPQLISGNAITSNNLAGINIDLKTGTSFDGDIVQNNISSNAAKGIHIESHSYGVGATLPLDPSDPLALPGPQDISFNVNIGSDVSTTGGPNGIPLDGNVIDNNGHAGIVVEVLDLATGSFEIKGNKITSSVDDNDASTGWAGDGIYVALESDEFDVDANSLLAESVIENNIIGVDAQGNDGNGLNFLLTERTRIQDLEVVKNFFGNNGADGFHFERTENGSLNAVVLDDNDVTNNLGDGFDLYAQNSVDDRLDFKIQRNDINNNAEYGLRINVQAAARIEVDFHTNDVIGNGHSANGNGFHPNDAASNFTGNPTGANFLGNAGAAGGVGIFGFEEVEVVFNATDSRISQNVGDGFSVDALDERDTLRVNANFTDMEFIGNTLTGVRSNGIAFGTINFVSSLLNHNREDGLRIVAVEDKNSTFETRVGGSDITVTAIGNQFVGNWLNGAVLGQGVSAVMGNGTTTAEFANIFDGNGYTDPAITGTARVNTGGDGLKIVQDAGPYLHSLGSVAQTFQSNNTLSLGRRRVIQTQSNFFRNNGGHGIDIGHDVSLEGGNVEHGYEVVSDTDIIINNAVISSNDGDGIEYLADGTLRVPSVAGGGQYISNPTDVSSLYVSDSRIESNEGRGIDILNRVNEDSRIVLVNNEVLTNNLSGVYVMNTLAHEQVQFGPNDPLFASTTTDIFSELVQSAVNRANSKTPNIELRVQSNNILDNGNQQTSSTVPIPQSGQANDSTGVRSLDWTHDFRQVTGTLGGLVVRVGTADTLGLSIGGGNPFYNAANTEVELGLSGIDAEVVNNTFNGNFGASVFLDSFVSIIPPQSQGYFNYTSDNTHLPGVRWTQGYRDPLARLDMVFRGNSGNSLDVTNGFAFIDNDENYFKSRNSRPFSTSPPHDHAHGNPTLAPTGGFTNWTRSRNATRTLGVFNSIGEAPSSAYQVNAPEFDAFGSFEFSFEGHGTSTWRVESDYDFDNFNQTSTIQGFSTFEDTVELVNTDSVVSFNNNNSILSVDPRYSFQWDTGRNTTTFTGLTPYSLSRGDIFNVDDNEDPIQPDGMEENDSFQGASQLGVLGGNSISVNAFTNNSLQPGVLNIDHKGDRDYYRFKTHATFANPAANLININVGTDDGTGNPIDPDGDSLRFMIYEVRPLTDTEEVPLIQQSGIPQYTSVANGGTGFIQVTAKPNTEYIIEILSAEESNLGTSGGGTGGTNFVYGTTRGYTLSLDAPIGTTPVLAGAATGSGSAAGAFSTFVTGGNAGQTAAVSIPDEAPTVGDITDVQPNAGQPINVAVNTITVQFSEDVTGVDLSDFQLTRDGNIVALAGAIFNPIDLEHYEITNLAPLTNIAGDYVFSVKIDTSAIIDTDGVALVAGGNDSESWTLDNLVSATYDARDNIPGDGQIADANGNRTLRAAINEANANPGADIIHLAPGTYLLDIAGRSEDEGFKGDFDVLENLTIRGTGADATETVIDGAQIDRVFHIYPGVNLTLENLTVRGGEAYDGGGFFIEGTATPDGVVSSTGGMLNIVDVNIIDNEAYNQGGGIYNLGTVNASRSSISRNEAGSRGGGVFNHGKVELVNSTLSSNMAVSRGGGLFNERQDSAVNPTIRPIQTVGSLYALNSTIAFNSAGAEGGGLYQEGTATFEIGNTIIEKNTASSSPDLQGTVNSMGFNFIGDLDGTPADALLQNSDIVAEATVGVTEAGLAPLSSNGPNGTWHHALNAGAYVIDAGSNTLYADETGVAVGSLINEFDQVKRPRQVEGNNDGAFSIDIGATEFFVSQPVAIITATPNPAGVNETVNLSAALSTHTLVPGSSKITMYEWDFNYDGTFDPQATGVTATTSYPAIGQFVVALRVTDDTNQQDLETVVINVNVPSKPVITAPFTGGTSDSTPTIAWSAGTGAFTVTVTDADGQVVFTQTGVTENSYTPTTSLPPGTYTAVVTASNASGTAASDPHTFQVVQLSVLEPAHQSIQFDTTPEFIFTAIPNAERYQVWVSQQDPADRRTTIAIPINDSFVDASGALIAGTSNAMYESQTSLGEGYYRVWVRAIESNGNAGDWSTANQFQIVRPAITGPIANGGATIDSTPTFTWTDIGANQYEIWISQLNGTDANGNVVTSPLVVANVRGIQGTSYTPPNAIGDGDFRVWVRALDDDGEPGLWSPQYNFTKNLNAGPTLIFPIGGETVTDRTPEFVWQAQDGATHYEIWVNNITTGQVRQIHNTNVQHVPGATEITYTDPDAVLRNASYRWWVRAFNEDGQAGAWSQPSQFFVPTPSMTGPGDPNPNAPIVTISDTNLPTFSWTTVPEYVRFELWVNNVDTGASRVIYEPSLTTNSFTPDLPLENGTFRAWVRAFDDVGNASQWSNPNNFILDATVGNAPQLLAPTNFSTDNTPTFEWTALPNVTQYEILVKNMLLTGQPTVLNQVVPLELDPFSGNPIFTATTNLASGTYRWWIRGLNADGNPGPWAQPLDFRVASSDMAIPRELEDVPEPEVLFASIQADELYLDDLRSITVHPAAVVATLTVDQTEQVSAEQTLTEEAEATGDVDSVMEELATADWWMGESDEAISEDIFAEVAEQLVDGESAVVVASSPQQANQAQGAAVLGIALATTGHRQRKLKRDEE